MCEIVKTGEIGEIKNVTFTGQHCLDYGNRPMWYFEGIALMADVSYAAPKFNGIMPTYWDFYFWGTKGLLKFNIANNEIHIFKNDEEIIECPGSKSKYLEDFILEINGENTIMNTEDILKSQRQTLEIQKASE